MPDNTPGAPPEPMTVAIPDTWAADESMKGFFTEKDTEDGAKVKAFDLEGLSKAYAESQAKIAALPAAPKTADEYKFEFPEGFPTDQFEPEFKARKEFALKAGLSSDQFSQLMSHDLGVLAEKSKAFEAERSEAHKKLKAEWGGNYDANIAAAQKAITAVFGERIAKMYDPAKDTDPDIIRGMLKIAKGMKEDTVHQPGIPAGDPPKADQRPRSADGRPMIVYPYMQKAS